METDPLPRKVAADSPTTRLFPCIVSGFILIGRKEPEGDVSFEQPVNLSGAVDADAVVEHEDFQQQNMMIGRAVPAITSGFWVERLKPSFGVEVVNRVRDESLETALFDPLVEIPVIITDRSALLTGGSLRCPAMFFRQARGTRASSFHKFYITGMFNRERVVRAGHATQKRTPTLLPHRSDPRRRRLR